MTLHSEELDLSLGDGLGEGPRVWEKVWERVWEQVWEQVWERVWESVWEMVWEKDWEKAGPAIEGDQTAMLRTRQEPLSFAHIWGTR